MLFNVLINYLDDGTECTFSKSGGRDQMLEGSAETQRDLGRLEK